MTAPTNPKRRSIVLIAVIAVALVIAGLLGTELYARHHAASVVSDAVQCEISDTAEVSFGVTPPVLWQYLKGHYRRISVHTAGNQVRDVKGMQVDLDVEDIRLDATADSKGTIGSMTGTVTWTAEGIKESIKDAVPVLGSFLAHDVTTDASAGTIELEGMLNKLVLRPEIVDGGLALKIVKMSIFGHDLSEDEAQSGLDELTDKATRNYPLGIQGDSVEVTDSGVTAHFSSSNATIPNSGDQDPCLAKL